MKIDELIKSLGIAVQEAHSAISDKSVEQFFSQHFELAQTGENNELYRPKMIGISLLESSQSNASKVIYVPTAALVTHKELALDEVKIDLDINISDDDGNVDAMVIGNGSPDNAGKLEIVFKCTNEAEGLARVETQLDGMI